MDIIIGKDDSFSAGLMSKERVRDLEASFAALHCRLRDTTVLDQAFRDNWMEECERLVPGLSTIFKKD